MTTPSVHCSPAIFQLCLVDLSLVATSLTPVVQLALFLNVDAVPLCASLYTSIQRSAPPRAPAAGKRKRDVSASEQPVQQAFDTQAMQQLLAAPHVAEAVLAAPCAHRRETPLTLGQLFDRLPKELHAAAARGYFGANCSSWCFQSARDVVSRAAPLLALQPQVTEICMRADVAAGRSLQLLDSASKAGQLTALRFSGQLGHGSPGEYCGEVLSGQRLRKVLRPLRQLRALELRSCRVPATSMHALADVVTELRQLTAVVVKGDALSTERQDEDVAAFVNALTSLPMLQRLGLLHFCMFSTSTAAVAQLLAADAPRLTDLNLSQVGLCDLSAATMHQALASCTSLTALELPFMNEHYREAGIPVLCGMQAPLQKLAVRQTTHLNLSLSSAHLMALLAMPLCKSLTHLALSGTCIGWQNGGAWQRLCELPKLQVLSLCRIDFEDCSEFARCIGSLTQLRSLGIDVFSNGEIVAELVLAAFSLPQLEWLACTSWLGWTSRVPVAARERARARGLQLCEFDEI